VAEAAFVSENDAQEDLNKNSPSSNQL